MGTRTIQNVYPVYRRFPCEATKISSRRVQFKRFSVWYSRPCSVNYFRISGESVSCDHHLGLHVLTRVVRQHRPQHLIVCLRGNDLDVADWDRSAECVLAKLVTFLTQLRNIFLLKTVTILSYIPRQRTRSISPDLYKLRVIEANCLLQDFCKHHQLSFWNWEDFLIANNRFCVMVSIWIIMDTITPQTIQRNSPFTSLGKPALTAVILG